MEHVGERLKRARERCGITQTEAAARLGISNGTLSGYERNYREPDMKTLRRLAELYRVSIDYLLTGREFTYSDRTHDSWARIREGTHEELTQEEIEFLRGCLELFRRHAGKGKS